MAVKTIDNLRAMVVDIVKVKANTDPTKTQGIRLRQLLNDILDTVQDLVDSLGLSVLSEMQNNEAQQDAYINTIKITLDNFIAQMPDVSDIVLQEMLPDFSKYALKVELFSKQYADILNAPDLSVYQLKKDVIVYDLSQYAKKSDIPANQDLSKYQLKSDVVTYDLTPYALKSQIPVVPTYDFSIYQKTTDTITYSRLTGTPTIPAAQVNSDWNSTSGLSQILNKPTLVTAYSQLSGLPTLFNGTYAALTGKPTLFSGSYTDLLNIPTTFTPSAHTHTIADITGLQTTLNSITKYYSSTALVTQNIKKWITVVTPTTASGFSVDISSAGFTTVLGVQVQVERNTATVSDVPQVALKTKSNTTLTFNITQTNTATVNVAGINVLSGLPLIFASNLSTILLHIEVTGY